MKSNVIGMLRNEAMLLRPGKRGAESKAVLPDYNSYTMSVSQLLWSALWGAAVMGGIAYVFYNRPLAVIVFALIGTGYPFIYRKGLIRKQKDNVKLQFKQLLAALSSALGAGRSVESAMQEALNDLRLLYPDSGVMIIRELEVMNRKIENGETVEACMIGFSRRAGIAEIEQFTDVFVTCKRLGGSLVQVVRRTAMLLQEKLEIEQETKVLLAQKRFEAKVLTAAPLVIVAALAWSTPDYMEPLYTGGGPLIMTGALVVFAASFFITQKIMDIKV
ncbi:type II secretion system F family protein [Paenibacillus allorhizosphaerae]|uniref:Type II secretion system protein GspF domain-containing protein n=1 Tax=Paenibacillus allorhizosphaerae TaxID=2849866 RepID=A0ABM8VL48_9BACL|nr:type II secretion system F family protein [Paenibacillus allorhizosphaerae]CAG7648110.1 hypothetical protein PAECIP111802_04126 [Paenibacillus allorhizosphaerae]